MPLFFALGCGANVRLLHQSETHFERCYSLDLAPDATDKARAACWGQWSESYSKISSKDRARYAIQRRTEISQGAPAPALRVRGPENEVTGGKNPS